MGRLIDEYKDIKLQQECVSKTINALWKMAQKYQKIEQIVNSKTTRLSYEEGFRQIKEVVEDGRN